MTPQQLGPRVGAWSVVLALCLDASSPVRALDPSELIVATYNIHHGVGEDDALDLRRIAAALRDSGAAVIGLQEVDKHFGTRSQYADQASELGRLLMMEHVYGANIDLPPEQQGGARRQYGTAIVSAYPIVSWSNVPLPNLGGEQRGLLSAEIDVNGMTIRVLNTHLQNDDPAERSAQTAFIAERLASIDQPVILLGDLNAEATASELNVMESLLQDTWLLAGEGPGFTFPAAAPNRRIDYVFTGLCMPPTRVTVGRSLASDHLPLAATLSTVLLLGEQLPRTCDRPPSPDEDAGAH